MNENMEMNEQTPEQSKRSSEVFDWVQCIASALIVCILIFVFLFRTVGVIGSSMVPTLTEGDRLIISNLFYTPKYGDIVVLRKDSFMNEPIIKRVIATEGQTIDIDFDNGIVYVDGVALDEPYIKEPTYRRLDFVGEQVVPQGCVFCMGDNRNGSTDSRRSTIGMIDTRCILGKVIFRLWPLHSIGGLY